MSRLFLGVIAAISSLILAGCAHEPIKSTQKVVAVNQKWTRFLSKDCKFFISLPGTPTIEKSEIKTKNGTAHLTNFSVPPTKEGDLSSYTIVCGQFPAGHLQKFEPYDFLERTWKGRFSDIIKDRLVYEKRIIYAGFPAIEFQYKSKPPQNYLTTARYCAADNSTYLICIIASQSATHRNADRYFDSFHVTRQK